VAPLFHIGALNTHTLGAIYRGSTNVIRRVFDPATTLQDLQSFPVNGLFAVPAMFAAIARAPGFAEADLSGLRLACAAGAPVPPSLLELYRDKGVLIQQAWGLTETAPCATYLEAAYAQEKLGSAGVPMPYGEVRVSDLDSHEVITTPGETGELWVRGPNVSPGYWNNPDATAAAYTADGWFRTGDIGYVDEDGFFFVVDRLKDMVISGGENIYPAEVERVLQGHPKILDAAVVGAADDTWGESVVAVIATDAGVELALEDVREYCARELARYKLPRHLIAVDVVPRNASGKLDKVLIRAMVKDRLAS
jgi:fatty-acyl-CoA synthase